jgi:hypothetical protein
VAADDGEIPVNFIAIATEIMLTANEEKWQETRQHIADVLRGTYAIGARDGRLGAIRFPSEDFQHAAEAVNPLWRDQPDGVR